MNPDRFCTLQCIIGCGCKKGYVKRSDTDGRCIKPEQCENANSL
ncbi:hypothetical protein B4U79_05700 [Dinothrombium tinctorium]|uniref:TIL domain-containing protein n=1 Tax=Dinothrombium tinctorium TaxID=1965070 RepID=A0A3S3NKB4_9ACAR|nr:hypothetical protein B4U79_09462 [Dinothrombium tinctorium]RWS04391.1 hypothetical protein B4U79_05700 [Dinothrombium tinctorium]